MIENKELYICEINDMIPYSIDNLGEMYFITGKGRGYYETIVYENNGNYIDINHPERILNTSNVKPIKSKDYHIYTLNIKSLRKYNDNDITLIKAYK